MARRILKLNDSAWLFADGWKTPMQVGMLATFSVPDDRPDFVADLVRRWREVREYAPPFNYRLRMTPVPGWVELDADEIDLDYHLRHSALPSPGSQRDLGVLVSRLHSRPLDRRYPLWEAHVIEGLHDEDGRARWSLYMKAHHSQVDGVGGIRMLQRMVSVDPDQRDMLPGWAIGTHGPDQSGLPPKVRDAAEIEATTTAGRGPVGLVRDAATSAIEVGGALARTYAETVTGLGEEHRAAPFRAPKTIFNGRIHAPRRFATQHYPIDRLKRIARACDASLNDVFLALCGGALRSYLLELGQLPSESMIANVPVSVREETGARVGNAISFLYATMGTDVADPVERVRAIHASTALAKDRLPTVGPGAMDLYTAVLMAPFLGQAVLGAGGHGRPAANVVVSNVPGPREPRYFDGSRLDELYPISLLFNGQALNITAVSYAAEFNIGFTGCRDSIPSLQRIAVFCGEEVERLEEALGLNDDGDDATDDEAGEAAGVAGAGAR